MIKRSLRDAAYRVAPRVVVDTYLRRKMLRHGRDLARLRDSPVNQPLLLSALWKSHFFRPLQKRSEILALAEIIRELRPSTICEIGAAGGGTTFLLAQAAPEHATLITLDLAFTSARQEAVSRFALPGQNVICLQRDSHNPDTVRLVADHLAGELLDVLYIDGDHSYEGIKADFQMYSSLVRSGGLIVFHDIVPDYKTRYGIETTSDVGGVPQFWREVKAVHADVEEIIENPGQDGYGIGVLRWTAEPESSLPADGALCSK